MNWNLVSPNKGGQLMTLENQKSHYRNMINPRKSMQISEDFPRQFHTLTTRYDRSRSNQMRHQENERIAKILNTIKNGKGILGLMEERSKEIQNKKHSLVTDFSISEKKREIKKGNKRMVEKIDQVKPHIGTSEFWEERLQNLTVQRKRLSKVHHSMLPDAEILLSEKNPNFKHNLKETLEEIFSKTSKSSTHRKNRNLSLINKNKSNHKISHTAEEILGSRLNHQKLSELNEEELHNQFQQEAKVKEKETI